MNAPEIDQVTERIRTLIEKDLGVEVESEDTDLLESGLLDSLAVVTLIAALEDTFGCEFPLEDFDFDHFRSISTITTFVAPLAHV